MRPLAMTRGRRWPVAMMTALALVGCTTKHAATPATAAPPAGSASVPRAPDGEGALRGRDDGLPHAKKPDPAPPAKPPVRVGLSGGLEALEASDYATAETELKKASQRPNEKAAATVGLARVALATGHYPEAVKYADQASFERAAKVEAAPVKAEALARQGKVEEGVRACEAVKAEPEARRARLVLGELLLRQGKHAEAEAALMTLIDDFNQKTITASDGSAMALVGRAAYLLRSKRDANDAFDDAERAKNQSPELFVWRARLFLDAYNYGRAEEMAREALKRAPDLAAAHVVMADVRLAQTLDFDAAEGEVRRALAVNRAETGAYFVRAGIALHDAALDEADRAVAEGLAVDANDLELLSMRAAVRFLADDKPGFAAAVKAVLSRNADYARVYQVVAEYADWEHRYDEIVAMMKEATRVDPDDGQNLVTLGLNQIRTGDEVGGLQSLDRGFRKDKFNVRAFNTLNLYEKKIPADYETVDYPNFHIRYPKAERKMLERYVPAMLDEAWSGMVRRYGFTPQGPIGIEIYGSKEDFSIRTSGLPNVGIQGVCFGKTLAAMSPKAESSNWGNVLWHELGHVFAIQLSKSHVPRWFTEGLSEYETIARRPEWRREEDPALWVALRRGRVPAVARMNYAFTHADDARDMTTAYYAASQIAVYLVETYKMDKLDQMLRAWGEGRRTPEVISSVLGVPPEGLDAGFRAWLDGRLVRYRTQYVPDLRAPEIDAARKAVAAAPNDPHAQLDLALASIAAGDGEGARAAIDRARALAPSDPAGRFLTSKLLARRGDRAGAARELEAMIAEGHDGVAVRTALGDSAAEDKDVPRAMGHYEAAARLDPTQAEPLQALIDLAHKAGDSDRELTYLRQLAGIEQHDRRVWRRLLTALVARKAFAEAVRVGEGAMFVDVYGAESHAAYAEALFATGAVDKAAFEADSALLCEGLKADVAARAHLVLAKAFLQKHDPAKARAARDEALRQDPNSAEAKALIIP